MLAGFLAACAGRSAQTGDAFKQALAVAAASAMTDRPAHFERGDLEQLQRKVEMRAMRD
jgi:fructose-1-phosphate kinase PfkB-like protein